MKNNWLGRGVVVLSLAFLGPACGSGKMPLYPAEGKVFFNDKPAQGAIVWLHPVGASDPAAPRPRGRADKDGVYRLGTFGTSDGAPAGKYQVTVFWTAESKTGDMDGKNLLPTRYQDPQHSGLPVIEIKEGANQLPALRLTR